MKSLLIDGDTIGFPRLGKGEFRGIPASGPVAPGEKPARNGPLRSATQPFRTVAGVPLILAAGNEYRQFLIIQNNDPALPLFFNFGSPPSTQSGRIVALGNLFMDYRVPTDSVWIFSTAPLSGFFMEMAPTG